VAVAGMTVPFDTVHRRRVLTARIRRLAAKHRWLEREQLRLERRRRAVLRLSAFVLRRIDRARAELVDVIEVGS
jgi:hypothetical protein